MLLVLVASTPPGQAGDARRLRLPSAAATIRARIRAEQLLRGGRGPERTLPGEVRDHERVEVSVSAEGVPQSVVVAQRLDVRGVGDFFVKIPGPVEKATALPGSTSQPGLRSGSLVWQGFASDGENLGARVELDPRHEAQRLPLRVEARARVDGEPVEWGDRVRGSLELIVEVANATGVRTSLPSADAPAVPVARALDSVRDALARGRRPAPGEDGLPRSMATASRVRTRPARVAAPLSVRVRVSLDRGSTGVDLRGATSEQRRGRIVLTKTLTLSGETLRRRLRLTARVPASRPRVEVEAVPAVPPVSEVSPPGARSWTVAAASGRVAAREMVDRLVLVLAEVARLPDVDAYLGNPDRDGPATTEYVYTVVAEREPVAHRAPPPSTEPGASPWGIAAAVLAVLLCLAGLTVWWALS